MDAIVRRFETDLECRKPEKDRQVATRVHRQWCALADLEQKQFLAPKERRTFLGTSIGIQPGGSVLRAVSGAGELAVLVLDAKGALVLSLRPSSDQERKELTQAAASLAFVLKGRDDAVHVAKPIEGYMKSVLREHLHPLQTVDGVATYEARMPSSIYSVKGTFGEGYVVVEQAEDGFRLNLFPAVPVVAD